MNGKCRQSRVIGVRLCFLSVMEYIIAVSPFSVKLLRRRIAFAITEGREERGDAEIIIKRSVPPYLRLLRVLRRRQRCGVGFNAETGEVSLISGT